MRKKRKAQQVLAAVPEDEPASCASEKRCLHTVQEEPEDLAEGIGQQVRAIVEECLDQVEAKAINLIQVGRQRVQHLRTDADVAILKLTKQVRETSVADFFQLDSGEAHATSLGNVLQRLKLLQGLDVSDKQGADAVVQVAVALATAGDAALKAPDAQPETSCQRNVQPQPGPTDMAEAAAPSSSHDKSSKALALMPPPPPRAPLSAANPPARAPMQNEVFYSANGSPIYLGSLAAPATLAKTAGTALTDATPAAGLTALVAPPQTMAFTGRTFRRATVARSRTRQAMREITVTTADGKQFTVDDLIGLAGVPSKYRDEVRKLVEADLQDLKELLKSVNEIEESNTVAAAPANSRPTRRR